MSRQRGLSSRIGIENTPVLSPGDEIWLYKRGSAGIVVGKYNSLSSIVECERKYNDKFNYTNLYNAIKGIGGRRGFFSLYHQCKVRPVIKKIDGKS